MILLSVSLQNRVTDFPDRRVCPEPPPQTAPPTVRMQVSTQRDTNECLLAESSRFF